MRVVDASVVVDLLAPPDADRRQRLLAEVPEPSDPWLAPEVLTFEVFAVLRRYVLHGALTPDQAWRRLELLAVLPLEFVPTAELLRGAWDLRDNVSAADSLYLALAIQATAELLTTDERLGRAAAAVGVTVRAL